MFKVNCDRGVSNFDFILYSETFCHGINMAEVDIKMLRHIVSRFNGSA